MAPEFDTLHGKAMDVSEISTRIDSRYKFICLALEKTETCSPLLPEAGSPRESPRPAGAGHMQVRASDVAVEQIPNRPPKRNDLVFFDTNALIEAFRVRAWSAMADGFAMATVETCCEETGPGDPKSPGYIAVDVAMPTRTGNDVQNSTPAGLVACSSMTRKITF